MQNKPLPAPDTRAVEEISETALDLLRFCDNCRFEGYDPYDALNSRLLKALGLMRSKWFRLAATQGFKRFPWNLRPLFLIPRSHNPKGIALFISALLKLQENGAPDASAKIDYLTEKLMQLRSPGVAHWCWGYNFDWQMREALVPAGSPNIICTTFAANALLDLYARTRKTAYLSAAESSAEFILNALRAGAGADTYFRYTPITDAQIHNANLLGAALLARVYGETGNRRFLDPALAAARFSVARQYPDGSWDYGERDRPSQRWKDNFHTGFNLCALAVIGRFTKAGDLPDSIRRGHDYFRRHFFCPDGAPRYYHNSSLPFDIHSAAQSIITLLALADLDPDNSTLAMRVFRWTLDHLWDKRRGFFYYQKHAWYTNRIPYMRWGQAWMLLAISHLAEAYRTIGRFILSRAAWRHGMPTASAPGNLEYVLITPARNEAAFIELTLKSVARQTVLPKRWIIVSNGSTDETDAIVTGYAERHSWLTLIRVPDFPERTFAAKVAAFNIGYAAVSRENFDIVANLDADLSFDPDFFEFLLEKFAANPRLGIGGTPFRENGRSYNFRFSSVAHVSGACQLFRRRCFENIGGYIPVKGGGIDVLAVLSARMHGWETRTFTEKHYDHHRKMGTAHGTHLRAKFRDGQKDYALGAHPLWEVFRSLYQMTQNPALFGGCALLWGYMSAAAKGAERVIPEDLMAFRRRDQMFRLRLFARRLLPLRRKELPFSTGNDLLPL